MMIDESVPQFSIIMPVYNKEPYIRNTISSILNQTYDSYEVIMIGGASTDDTDKICQEISKKYPNKFRYILQSGHGISIARNDGILVSEGKYIAFLDADDIWMPEYLSTMNKLINDYPEAVFYASGFKIKYPEDVEIVQTIPVKRGTGDYFTISTEYNGRGITTSWIVYNKKKVMDVGLFNDKYILYEDADLATRMAISGEFAYEPKTMGIYHADLPDTASKKTGFNILIPGDSELSSLEQTPNIIQYREYWIQRTALDNILKGNNIFGREQLKRIKKNYKLQKVALIMLSYFHPKMILILKKVYHKHIWMQSNYKDKS